MKFQLNIQVTGINSSLLTDKEVAAALKCGKNEGAAFDVQAIAEAIHAALSERSPQAVRRSAGGNLTVAIPLKVEGSFLTKVDLSAPTTKASSKQTDAEKRKALLSDLGL